jgi:hypothetical protein
MHGPALVARGAGIRACRQYPRGLSEGTLEAIGRDRTRGQTAPRQSHRLNDSFANAFGAEI